MPVEQITRACVSRGFERVEDGVKRLYDTYSPTENALNETLSLEATCGEIDPLKLVSLVSEKRPRFKELIEKRKEKFLKGLEAKGHVFSDEKGIYDRIVGRQVAVLSLEAIRDMLSEDGKDFTLENVADFIGVEKGHEQTDLGVEQTSLKLQRVNELDGSFIEAVEFEAGVGGEDVVTLQAIIDA